MPQSSGLYARTISGLLWTGLGTGVQTLLQFLVLIILSRLLTPADFGIVAAAILVVGFAQIFSSVGVGPAIVQRPNLELNHIRTAFTLSLLLGSFFFGLVWLAAPSVETFFRMDGLTEVLRLVASVFPIKAIGVVSESLAQRHMRFRFLSVGALLSYAIGYAGLAVTLAWLEWGPFALVWAYIGQAAVMTVFLLFGSRHSLKPIIEIRALRELLYFGSGHTLAVIGNYAALQGDNAIVARVMDAATLGIYGRAYQIMSLPATIIGSVLDKVLFPAMATIQTDKYKLSETYRRGCAVTAILVFPTSMFMLVFSSVIVDIILGDQWLAVVLPLQILSIGLVFRTGYKVSDSLVRATGAVYQGAWRQWIYALSVVTFSAIGTTKGLPGVAFGVVAAVILKYGLLAQLSLKLTAMEWRDFAWCHMPALLTGLGGLMFLMLTIQLLKSELSTNWIMLISAVGLIPFFLALWIFLPKLFLGKDGEWLRDKLVGLW